MSLEASATEGYKLVEGWQFTMSADGQTGTKVYLVGSPDITGLTREACPKIGDSWDTDYTDVTCKSITKTFLPGCTDSCKWMCNYDTTPFAQVSTALSADDTMKSVDVGGEFISWEPKKGSGWTYADGGAEIVSQPLFRNAVQSTIRMPVIVSDFPTFFKEAMTACGTVNDADFQNIPSGNVLFVGCNVSEFKNAWGAKRWRAELNFVVRSIGDMTIFEAGDTWQYILDINTGTWTKAIKGAELLYEESDFSDLFNHSLGTEEDLYPNPPAD